MAKSKQFTIIYASFLFDVEKILNTSITEIYNSDDVIVIPEELRLTKISLTSFTRNILFYLKQCQQMSIKFRKLILKNGSVCMAYCN